jgi:receptor expression-enhancing protein 5/6
VAFNKTVQDLEKIKLLKDLEAQTGVKVPYLAGGAAAFVVLFTYFVFGPGLLCNLIGFFYPVYASIKAVETDNKEDDTRWLIYWIIYAFFNIIETFSDVILYWFPFYFALKAGFLVWLMLPNHMGAKVIYDKAIRPFVKKHEAAFGLGNQGDASTESPSKKD